LDLEPIAFSEGPKLADTLEIPFTYCWFPALVPKMSTDVCGVCFRHPPDYTPPPKLVQFMRGGPTPIYFGFGSIVIDDPYRMTSLLLEAIKRPGVRALISRG
jgi:hypothetical protein